MNLIEMFGEKLLFEKIFALFFNTWSFFYTVAYATLSTVSQRITSLKLVVVNMKTQYELIK